jgi:hypothetical protein
MDIGNLKIQRCINKMATTHSVIDVFEDPPPRINLSNSEDVRREMAKVYREARQMKIATSDGTKLVFILCQILKAYEIYLIEERIKALEDNQFKYPK